MNFNNTINSSFITLFCLLIGSNGHVITSIHCIFYGNSFVRINFILFNIFGGQIAYNLILAATLDHVISQIDKKSKKNKNTNKIKPDADYIQKLNKEYTVENYSKIKKVYAC